jgi:hypothetical protein
VKHLLALTLPLLLGSCALLGAVREQVAAPPPASPVVAPSPALSAQAAASTTAQGVTVTLTLTHSRDRAVTLRYAAQVNWADCGLPPYVALARGSGAPLPAPAPGGRLSCPELQFTRTLAPGEALTLRRTLPPLPPGSYTLTAWFDGELEGQPLRVQAAPVLLEVR